MIYLVAFIACLVALVLFEILMMRADTKASRLFMETLNGNLKDAVHIIEKAAKAIDDDRHTRFAEQLATEIAAYKEAQKK